MHMASQVNGSLPREGNASTECSNGTTPSQRRVEENIPNRDDEKAMDAILNYPETHECDDDQDAVNAIVNDPETNDWMSKQKAKDGKAKIVIRLFANLNILPFGVGRRLQRPWS